MSASNESAHFYVTLLSNASLKIYPSNTLSSFTLHLAQPVNLGSTDRWEVGVLELSCCPFNVGTYNRLQVISANVAVIYCNLISQEVVGSQYVIQRTTYCNHFFDNVYYMPVKKRRFQDIQIQIQGLDGTLVSFADSDVPGKILHFRRVSTQ
jgi:hypothetical protein